MLTWPLAILFSNSDILQWSVSRNGLVLIIPWPDFGGNKKEVKGKVRSNSLSLKISLFSPVRDCKSFLIKSSIHTFNSWCTQDLGPTAPIYMLICYRELQSFSIPKAQEIVRLMLCCNYWYLRQPVHGQGAKCSGSLRHYMEPGGQDQGIRLTTKHDALHK